MLGLTPGDATTEPTVSKTKANMNKPRDPRLPAPGAILVKQHKGEDHEIKVLDSGFEYRGDHYRSLSALAKKITGTTWNGFLFLDRALKAQREVQAAKQ